MSWKDIFLPGNAPDLKCLRFRDPGKFIAGGVHGNPEAWEVVLKDHPSAQMLHCATLTPSQIYIFARAQAMFKVLFFSGDRAADLLLSKTGDVLRFPDDSGFLFNHLWTKTLRSGDANVFALKRGSNLTICPVRGLKLYFDVCKPLTIHLCPGFFAPFCN